MSNAIGTYGGPPQQLVEERRNFSNEIAQLHRREEELQQLLSGKTEIERQQYLNDIRNTFIQNAQDRMNREGIETYIKPTSNAVDWSIGDSVDFGYPFPITTDRTYIGDPVINPFQTTTGNYIPFTPPPGINTLPPNGLGQLNELGNIVPALIGQGIGSEELVELRKLLAERKQPKAERKPAPKEESKYRNIDLDL